MSTYNLNIDTVNTSLDYYQAEKHIYGSSRLGMLKDYVNVLGSAYGNTDTSNFVHTLGNKRYELSNHLGNVLTVISDKPIPHNNGGTVDYFMADIKSAQDYSPFGVTLSGRDFNSSESRYGFNGMEVDSEVKGKGNSYTTEFRQYDPRLGRWLSIDPLFQNFPWQSPYAAFDNNPIYYCDPLGAASESPQDPPKPGEDVKDDKDVVAEQLPEVLVTANRRPNTATIKLIEHKSGPGFWQRVGNWFRSAENQMKGTSYWTWGIEFKTHDGKHNGNTANPVPMKYWDHVYVLYWDDIEDFTTALKALDKELPKEFREQSGLSGPGSFMDEAKKWIGTPTAKTYKPNKLDAGGTFDIKDDRSKKPLVQKATTKNIIVKVWRTSITGSSRSTSVMEEGPYNNKSEMKNAFPNARWNTEKGYWEAGNVPK